MDIKILEQIAKIVLGSGLFAFLIAEIIGNSRRWLLKKKFKKGFAHELFMNEGVLEFIIKDFQEIQKDPCGYTSKHHFTTYVIDSILTSGYFISFSYELYQFILHYRQRFENVQYELDAFSTLTNEEKITNQNLYHAKHGEKVAKRILSDLRESKVFKKIKKDYLIDWHKEKIKLKEEIDKKKLDRKTKRKLIKKYKDDLKREQT